MNVKVDKTLVASVALHVLVLGWALVSFSSRALEMPPEDSVPVDVVSADQLAKAMAGMKTGKKENPKPLAEKVAEAKPVDDAVGKITEKAPVVTDTAPPPQPKQVEKKPDPPKPVAEAKPKEEPKKEEPKPVEKKPDPQVDPIAEALKKEEKKPPPKPVQAAKPPEQTKPKPERVFDQSKIAALIDKRDPSRQAVTGETLNSNAALGLSKGAAADNSATWGSMFRRKVESCWTNKPYAGLDEQRPVVVFGIKLKRDGTLEAMPVPIETPPGAYARAYQESAMRAIIQCQPYNLPAAFFEEWKAFEPVFQERPL